MSVKSVKIDNLALGGCTQGDEELSYLVCHVAMLWRKLLNERVRALGINGMERRTLVAVADYPGATQIQIARLLDVEPQNLGRALDDLMAQGFLEKRVDPADRRARCLFVTIKGKKLLKRIHELNCALKPGILTGLAETEHRKIAQHLGSMRSNLQALLGKTD